MDNGIYIMTTRQMGLFKDMEVTANNLANAATSGYNSEHLSFSALVKKDNNSGKKNDMAFSEAAGSYRDTTTGSMKATGNPLDVAINGSGYFSVETPLGTRYTRSGNFQIDGLGTLINAEGYPVMDISNQRITFPEDAKEITIGQTGIVSVDGQELATLSVSNFANEQAMERVSGTLFKYDATPEAAGENAHVLQGTLENSNVQPIVELTRMIDISRATTNTAKYVEMMYDLQRKADNVYSQAS